MTKHELLEHADEYVAVIGMQGRFPGAKNVAAFWAMLRDGREAVTMLSDQELAAAGVDDETIASPGYVKAVALLDNVHLFDAGFFGYTPREAQVMDPQHRIFLECAWEALEDAGYNSETYGGRIGVYAGVSMNNEHWFNLHTNPQVMNALGQLQTMVGNDKDFLTTRVSYELNLRGPSIDVQTACSTSLVAVHLACESLLNGECEMALAGGVSIRSSRRVGYWYQEGGIVSPDGHCRSFDANAQGTIFSSGVGIIVLKPLAAALDDGDYVHAVIRGSAINNDGSSKIGYTAPSVEGQARVVAAAHALAGVEPETISYIEAHGSATPLGDPVEVTALTRVFRAKTNRRGFCAIGSVKTNIGHADAAAGVAGLIKTILALKHRQIPASLHYTQPNPKIDFINSPFYVNTRLTDWRSDGVPRRAGVSSFGVGGTNAHVIVEEAPPIAQAKPTQSWQILALSAKTPRAIDEMTQNLHASLQEQPDINLADVAHTLQVGRRAFEHRRFILARDVTDAIAAVETQDLQRIGTSAESQELRERPVVFLLPGQGAQSVDMGRDLYTHEPVFRQALDTCADLLRPLLGRDLRAVLYPAPDQRDAAAAQLQQTALAQPALFAVSYALAQLWISWGVGPQALLGHSLGEVVAATLAGVFTLPDALTVVAARGRLMQACAPGAMLAVALSEATVTPLLGTTLSLAAVNGPASCVVSGTDAAIAALETQLTAQGVQARRLQSAHAFHSALLDPMLPAFRAVLAQVPRQPPQRPVISNVSGTWLTAAEATDPDYWVQQARQPVRFADGLATLSADATRILLEVGPGTTLSRLARQQRRDDNSSPAIASLRRPETVEDDRATLLRALGQLWLYGLNVDWTKLYADQRRRLPLPTYPFERERYIVEPQPRFLEAIRLQLQADPPTNTAGRHYMPVWRASAPVRPSHSSDRDPRRWLVFLDGGSLGARLAQHLTLVGDTVIVVQAGEAFRHSETSYTINPEQPGDYVRLLDELRLSDCLPETIVHLWSLTADDETEAIAEVHVDQARGMYSLLALGAAAARMPAAVQLWVVANGIQEVSGQETLVPTRATLLSPCQVLPTLLPQMSCRYIDLVASKQGLLHETGLVERLSAEMTEASSAVPVAYRGQRRWTQALVPVQPDQQGLGISLQVGGTYLIIGALNETAIALAHSMSAMPANVVLVLPPAVADPATQADSEAAERTRLLAALGTEIMTLEADLSDEHALQAMIDQSSGLFNGLNGIIYTVAPVLHNRAMQLTTLDWSTFDQALQHTIQPILALAGALEQRTLDFCLFYSSAASSDQTVLLQEALHGFLATFVARANQAGDLVWIDLRWEPATLTSDERWSAVKETLELGLPGQIIISKTAPGTAAARATAEAGATEATPTSAYPRPAQTSSYIAPRNETERMLAEIWQEVLGIKEIGVYDNFFDLGGHSLMATQIISRINDVFITELPFEDLFTDPTIAGVALVLSHHEQNSEEQAFLHLLAELTDEQVEEELQRRSHESE